MNEKRSSPRKYPDECKKRATYLGRMGKRYDQIREQLRKEFPQVFTKNRPNAPSDGWIRNCLINQIEGHTPKYEAMDTFGSVAIGKAKSIAELPPPRLLEFCKQMSADQNEYTKKFLAMQTEVERLRKENLELKDKLKRFELSETMSILEQERQNRAALWREK